ncbi:MAG: adenosylcobalamin-dependent ribonucleoside-diphosphate reductase [Alphaproteobacteria bacterium]|nr:adenosylcobalamin-dependent ribonucleoside-diphosphate reductase [Alphaproteobacteria bacterium]
MTIQEWLGARNQLGIDIWEKKYRHNNETFDAWLDRVSGGDSVIREYIVQKKFLFAGRILAGRGLASDEMKVSLSNCYVIDPPEDSLESIYECAKKMARTYSYGGGCGIDISKLAPRGARIRNAAKSTSGAVSFMDLFAMSTALIGQHGRRGALMISIDGRHPDLEEFIDIKQDLNRITKANTSIRVHDDFMNAARDSKEYTLSYVREATGEAISKPLNARDLLRRIAKNNWDMGEPGMLFWDRINSWNLLYGTPGFSFAGVNPCAEEPLPAGGACLLGSLNLSEFTMDLGSKRTFDFAAFDDAVAVCVRALNRVLDEGMTTHPLDEQKISAADWRQIGLGIFGLADMHIRLEMKYGSPESLRLCDMIGHHMVNSALRASACLARDEGTYPRYNAESVLNTPFLAANADDVTLGLVREYGLRNAQLLTIPPSGTISTMLGISSGIEPIFANYYTRKTESVHSKDVYYKVYTPSVAAYMEDHGIVDDSDLPEFFVTAGTLDHRNRVDMQAVWQSHIDASISSTVNLPETATPEDVENIYMYAWMKGLKGITVFRDNCKRAAILTTSEPKETASATATPPNEDACCPECGNVLERDGGCTVCKSCGFSYCDV